MKLFALMTDCSFGERNNEKVTSDSDLPEKMYLNTSQGSKEEISSIQLIVYRSYQKCFPMLQKLLPAVKCSATFKAFIHK